MLHSLGYLLLAYAAFNIPRMWMIDRRMRPYRISRTRGRAFPVPAPLRWRVENYGRPAYPLIDAAWGLLINAFVSAMVAVVLLSLVRP